MFYPHIKSEASASPDLSPFHFKFTQRTSSDPPTPLYRFGSYSTHHQPWSTPTSPTSHNIQYMSYSDDYDDIPTQGYTSTPLPQSSSADRAVRRRSSKACDQCRKSKCKCERSGPSEPCKSCIMLGTPCTFLGPSRKRGPPKGYIDAIEARLHQTEALVGVMLATKDSRAQSLLCDIAKDPLAKEIISRVDNSPYGVKGRKRGSDASKTATKASESKEKDDGKFDLTSTHPSNEWQDIVVDMLGAGRMTAPAYINTTTNSSKPSLRLNVCSGNEDLDMQSEDGRRRQRRRLDEDYCYEGASAITGGTSSSASPTSFVNGDFIHDGDGDEEKQLVEAVGELSLNEHEEVRYHGKASGLYLLGDKERVDSRNAGGIWRFPGARVWPPLPTVSESSSIPSESRVSDSDRVKRTHAASTANRTHKTGKSSNKSSESAPNHTVTGPEVDTEAILPSLPEQEHLLNLYFTYVHPSFPVVHKKAFWESWGNNGNNSTSAPRRRRNIAPLLLLAMFSLAARYDVPAPAPASPRPSESPSSTSSTPLPTDGVSMWTAGEQYLTSAKTLLDTSYASSKSSTCQALLLIGYREVGIGAMALAWTYTGMAIRMAQDLGMHRKAEGWRRPGLEKSSESGASADSPVEEGRLFGDWELGERRRIWFGCVVMDKYVSAYIGRPLMIFEKDFDTELPSLTESEEMEDWKTLDVNGHWTASHPGRIISCFNKSAELASIWGAIIQGIYAVRPSPTNTTIGLSPSTLRPVIRQSELMSQAATLEEALDKWYLDLPEHLRYDTTTTGQGASTTPPSHVLTLHMQYWCAVLLLHRPFIGRALRAKNTPSTETDIESPVFIKSRKCYELCASAANHLTSIVTAYGQAYPLDRCSVFLCYYVFTASIMHIISLTAYPDDPQARINLRRCFDVLSAMRYVWPSAGRALDLLSGAKVDLTADPTVNTASVNTATNPNAPKLKAASAAHKRKSVIDNDIPTNVVTNLPNGIVNSSGEYITPIRSNVVSQAHSGAHRAHYVPGVSRDRVQASQYRQPTYNNAGENYAIQPPTLLPTGHRWSDNSIAPPTTTSVLAEESNVRAARHPVTEDDHDFAAPLSTSVLPQLYSTGLVDEQSQHHHHPHHRQQHISQSHQGEQNHSHSHHHQQYSHTQELPHPQPQYWSDYSTFSQLGPNEPGVYAGLGMGVGNVEAMPLGLQEHQHQEHQHVLNSSQHSSVQGMYLPDSYEIYGQNYR